MGYLEKINEDFINVGDKSTLLKVKTETKAPPKMEDISLCLFEGFRRHEIFDNDDEIKNVVKDFIMSIDAKREIKKREFLKRLDGDAKNPDNVNKIDKKNKKTKNIDEIVENAASVKSDTKTKKTVDKKTKEKTTEKKTTKTAKSSK